MIGPVHEKETSTSVNAMKNMERRPVVDSDFWSILVVHDAGRVSSKAPKNDAAKTTRRSAKKTLNHALVDKALRALGPEMSVTARPTAT